METPTAVDANGDLETCPTHKTQLKLNEWEAAGREEGEGLVALAMILPLGCVATAASTHFPTRNLTLYTDCTTCPRQEDVINVVMGWDGMAST